MTDAKPVIIFSEPIISQSVGERCESKSLFNNKRDKKYR